MADDVASFFKSKKSKKHGSGQRGNANVQTPDALARRLERTVQQQQAFDRENGIEDIEDEFEPRPAYTQQFSGGAASGAGPVEQNNEESEWLDIQEQQEIDIEKIGIKELEIQEESDAEANDDEESLANRKTWNIPGQQQDKQAQKQKVTYAAGMDVDDGEEGADSGENAAPAAEADGVEKKLEDDVTESSRVGVDKDGDASETKQKYVPPSLRNKQLAAAVRPSLLSKKPNIEDSMEFPSLAAAGELEAELEKSKKKKTQPPLLKKSASPAPMPHAPSPGPVDKDTSQYRSEAKPTPSVPAVASTLEPVPEQKPAQPSTYVPPHLRKRGGAS